MNTSLNVVLFLITIPKAENTDKWLELREKRVNLIKEIETLAFSGKALKTQYYVESHQITIEALGDFSPIDESDLVLKYDNNEDFINTEAKVIIDSVLSGINYKLNIGKIKF